MVNLFFVYTPFQFYVAQEIISQEKLTNNILLKGYIGNSIQFLEIFDYLRIPELWNEEYIMPNLGSWLDVDRKRPWKSLVSIRKSYSLIKKIIKKNNVDIIYFGDINNFSARLSSRVFIKHDLKICFYEEGGSHYFIYDSGGTLSHHPLWARLYQFAFDLLLYLPVFHQRLGYYAFVKASPLSDIRVDRRYSIIPKYHDIFDRQLFCKGVIGAKANNYIKTECSKVNTDNCILFLDQPVYEIVKGSLLCYIDTIRDYFYKISKETNVVIKYHPRETDDVKRIIEDVFQELGFNYVIISKSVNLPVEFYLQQINFKEVVNFFTSAACYNGYLFKKISFKYLTEEFYNKCKERVPNHAHFLDGFVKAYKKHVYE